LLRKATHTGLDVRRFDSSSSIKGNIALLFKLYNMKTKSFIENAIIYAMTTLVAVTWTMLVFHLLTQGLDANASFGLY